MSEVDEGLPAFETSTARYPVAPRGRELLLLSIAALGIVYGDIGTSPLYALRVCFAGRHAVPLDPANVLGVLSLIFWTLVLVVGVKYHGWILRLDNHGEGGILALMGLVGPEARRRAGGGVALLGLVGVALFYGDGIMTPAISVLAAVEGMELFSRSAEAVVVPISVALLILLFFFQSRRRARFGRAVGAAMLLWFVAIAFLGVAAIVRRPEVLRAVDPRHAIAFLGRGGLRGFLVLGAVFLVATGAEALYADMGRFGRRPMRIDWVALVAPALVLNYFGQGALLLGQPRSVRNPFFLLAPSWALVPLVVLATLAALVAAQAVISGAFSLTRQAVQLGFLPRVSILHTSSAEMGQIYIRGISWAGLLGTVFVILLFRNSMRLADAYGVAISLAMAVTTVLAYGVSRSMLGWGSTKAAVATALFLTIDLTFVLANLVKIPQGGWLSLAAAAVTFTLMTTWRRGRKILGKRLEADTLPLDVFLDGVARKPRLRVSGTAVFMDRVSTGTPHALLLNLRHNKCMHERVVFLSVTTESMPFVSRRRRIELSPLKEGFYRINLRYGFMQDPHVPRALEGLKIGGRKFDMMDTTFFLGRETLIPRGALGMSIWRERVFALMARNATSAMEFFHLPPNRVVELGAQIEL
ncbi:MAG TPA: KUP/HAK/KT family potassium transporter [Thermoanaerobaculia bacterium]